jgi:hypothetical protein
MTPSKAPEKKPTPSKAPEAPVVQDIEIPPGVVPGETPGWPVDDDGKLIPLTNEQRTELAKEAAPKSGRVKIEKFTERGDWLDPFSGILVYFGADVCEQSGARRDGEYAVLES